MQVFQVHETGKVLISKQALLLKGIYTDGSYRANKSRYKIEDIKDKKDRWIFLDTIPSSKQSLIKETFRQISAEYFQQLQSLNNSGIDCSPVAVEFTAESLHINEPFIRSTIEMYINTHYSLYTWAYLDAGLHSDSVKGYSKQCALVQWIYDFVCNIRNSEANANHCEILLRSFRMNLLTALSSLHFEIKIPRSETRFNKWFDDIIKAMDSDHKPEMIIQIKRQNNNNAEKISPDQFLIAKGFYTNGTNMSVAAVYNKWIVYAKEKGWWMENGKFNPPTEARLYQLLSPLKNPLSLEKTDAATYRANNIAAGSRLLPKKKNHVWVIDGTAHNENVKHGNVRQHVYAIKVADVSTYRLVGTASLIGVKEPFYAVKEAILMGIRETGYKPAIIQADHGPASKELEKWCEDNDIKLYLSIAGNARGKTIESLFNMFDNDITRFLKGYSGQNRTATSINSRSSEKRETKGKQNARSASLAMEWIKNEGVTLWNERVIKTLERKPCGKTPYELWDEKESYVPKLSYIQLCQLCGTLHERKLTIHGLEIGHNRESYMYYPPIRTSEQRAAAEKIFTHIPLDAQTKNRLKIYILEGGNPAPVYSHDGKYLGIWEQKTEISYTAAFDGTKEEKEAFNNLMALQYRIEKKAKDINTEIKQAISMHPDYERIQELGEEMLTNKRRAYTGRYDKTALLEEEMNAKADDLPELSPKRQIKTLVDPDTGECYDIEI